MIYIYTVNRTKRIADKGRELVRDIHRPDYAKKEKKGKKKVQYHILDYTNFL